MLHASTAPRANQRCVFDYTALVPGSLFGSKRFAHLSIVPSALTSGVLFIDLLDSFLSLFFPFSLSSRLHFSIGQIRTNYSF